MFLERKTDQAYDRQWMSTHEVFWQYPLVTSSQLGVVRPFDGLDLRLAVFSTIDVLATVILLQFLHWKRRFLRRSSVGIPACSRRGFLEGF